MKFYIDTNTFPTNPALYADAEKSKRIPQILPVVQLTRGAVQIGFLGENPPPDGALVEFSATIAGTNTQVILARGKKTANGDAWEFNLNFNSEALSIALESKHADVILIAGIIVSAEAFRQEWQLRLSASETATGELDPKQVESAKDFADVAERAATRAEEAARNSEQSTQGASESAEAAQASAKDASKSQEAAAQSAKEAAQSKTDAVSAKNAAETAKTDAEKAKTDAEAAKTGAERARDGANEILRSVEREAESVETAGTQALAEVETAKQDAKAEIEAFTDVYTKSEIDGVDTGAEVTLKMNEIIAQLKDYEEVTGEKLPFDFWEAVMEEFQRWQENPTEVKEWVTTKDADGNITSTNPYYDVPPVNPVVDFNVTKATGYNTASRSFNVDTNVPVFISAKSGMGMFFSCKGNPLVILPNLRAADAILGSSKINRPLYFPNLVNSMYLATNANNFDSFAILPSASNLYGAFKSTAMSAKNIAKTLDSLPTWTDGALHRVTFTETPGAVHISTTETITVEVDGTTYTFDNFPKYTTDDENETLRYAVARAAAKGWTVQMGDPAGDVVKPTA